jgi:hypothetical protein
VFACVLFLGFQQKRLTLRGIGWGALVFLLSLLTVPALLAVIQLAIIQPALSTNPLLGPALEGETLLSNGIRWGSTILALATTFLWYALLRKAKKAGGNDLALGAFALLFIGAIGATIAFPAISYLFVWPLLADLLATVFRFLPGKGKTGQPGWPQFLGLVGAGVIAIVMFVPGILIALFSIDIRMIYLVPVFVVTLLGFLIPTLEVTCTAKSNFS